MVYFKVKDENIIPDDVLLEPGRYKFKVASAEEKISKLGVKVISCRFEVLGKDRFYVENYTIENRIKPESVRIGQSNFSKLLLSIGKTEINSLDELIDARLIVDIEIKVKGSTNEKQNLIRRYL